MTDDEKRDGANRSEVARKTSGNNAMTQAHEIIEDSYDVVIVGAGGAGLRAALGMAL